MQRVSVVALLLVGVLLAAGPAIQMQPIGKVKVLGPVLGVPERMNVQGYVTTDAGDTLSGSHSMTYRLFDVPSGGSELWSYSGSTQFQAGLFSVILTIPASHFASGSRRWLEIGVEGQTLSPRTEMTSAAFAYRSIKSDTAAVVPDGSVTTAKLANSAVTMAKLAQSGATAGQVAKWTGSTWAPRNDSVGAGGSGTVRKVFHSAGVVLSPNPITDSGTVRFDTIWGDARFVNETQSAGGGLAGTYPSPTIAPNAVSSTNIADGSVTTADIRDTTVNTADIKNGAITAPKLGQMGASSGQVMKWNGSAWEPRDDSVGGSAIAVSSKYNCSQNSWDTDGWMSIGGMCDTVATGGGPVLLLYTGGGFSVHLTSNPNHELDIGIFRDGSLIATNRGAASRWITSGRGTDNISLQYLDQPSSGTHIYDVRLTTYTDMTVYQNEETPVYGSNSLTIVTFPPQ